MWTISVGATAGVSPSIINQITSLTSAVGSYWGWYIDDDLADISIRLEFESLDDTTLATGSTTFYFDEQQGGFDVYKATTTRELQTGVDTNGAAPDIVITIDTAELNAGELYYGPVVNGVSSGAPAGQFDLFTILVHEVGHGLGLLTFIDEGGADRTNFDLSVTQIGQNYFFTGATAVGEYGSSIPLDSSIAHLAVSTGSLLGPTISSGGRQLLSALDVAIFADFGTPIRMPTLGADRLTAFAVGSSIDGLAGNDTLNGFLGDDTLFGGDGDDLIDGGPEGDDELKGGAGQDTIFGGVGADTVQGDDGNDLLDGGAGDDFIFGGLGDDTIDGGAGVDTLQGGPGADSFIGGGVDTVSYAASGAGVFVRLSTNQALSGHAQGDTFNGVAVLIGSSQIDILIGSVGADTLYGGDGADDLWGLGGSDYLDGGAGADLITGAAGNDTLIGAADNDTLSGGTAGDFLDGGAGFDWSVYAGAGASVYVRLDTGLGYSGQALGDTLIAIENIEATDLADILVGSGAANSFLANGGDDTLYGLAGFDTLNGAAGDDEIFGQQGDDVLIGGNGADTLTGGSGDDRFVFRFGDDADQINDFLPGAGSGDLIALSGFGAAFDSFSEVMAAASQSGTDTIIDFGNGDVIVLQNVLVGSLNAADFVFG